jgi:hypothetical protein
MQLAKSNSGDWRQQARECYDFAAGRQWSDEDQAILENQRRPPVTFNRVSRTLNAVIGLEVANRQEVRFIPRGNEDTGFNEMLTNAARWVRDLSDVEDEETEAFGDLNTCGMGWTDTTINYEEDPDGMIMVERGDPLGYFWDPGSVKKNLADARWLARVKRMSKDEILERWPTYEGGDTTGSVISYLDDDQQPHDASPPYYDNEALNEGKVKDIEVVYYQWFEKEEFVRVKAGERMVEFTPARFERLKDHLTNFKHVKQKRRVYYYAYKIGGRVYEKDLLAVQEGGFTMKCMTGMRDRNNGTWFGLVSIMIDPQRWANKWLSQTMHILNSNAKGGLLAEMGAFVNPEKAEAEWANPDSVTELNPGGLDKIREREMAKFPQGVNELMKYAVEAISDTPGINQELMGLVGRDQPGVLASMRKQAGVTMLSVMFDALRLYRKRQGRTLAAFIRDYISDGRLVRVVGQDGAKYVPLVRDEINLKYDTVIDEAPTSHNQKEKVMQILMTLVPQMQEAGMPPPPMEVLEYLPVPEALIEKWLAKAKPDPEKQKKEAQETEEERQVLLAERSSKAAMQQAQAKKAEADAARTMHELQTSGPGQEMVTVNAEMQKAELVARKDYEIAQMKARMDAEAEVQVAKIRGMTQAHIEKMKLEGAAASDQLMQQLSEVIGGAEAKISALADALGSVTAVVADSQRAVRDLQRPKKVTVLRDKNGDIVGAEMNHDAVA